MGKRIKDLSRAETNGYLAVDNATNGTGKMNTSVIFNNFAVKFVANNTEVFKGNLYIHEGVLYKAKENYKGAWDSSKFVQASASNYFQLDGDLTHKQVTSGNANTIYRDVSAFNFEEGKYYKVNIKLRNFSENPNAAVGVDMFGLYTLTDSSDYTSKVDIIYAEPQATISDKEVAIIFKASGDANYIYFYLSSGTANSVVLFDMTDGASIQMLGEMSDSLAGVVKKVSTGIEDPDVFSKVLTLEKTAVVGINRAMGFYKFSAGKSYRVKIDLADFVEGSFGEEVVLRTISNPEDFTSAVDVVYSLIQTTISEKHLDFIFTATGDARYLYLYVKSSTAGASVSVDVYDSKIEGTNEKADANPFSEILSGEYPSLRNDITRYMEVCNFKKGQYYKVVLELDDLYPKNPNTTVAFGLYTLLDKFDYTSKVDYIYEVLWRPALDEKKEIVFKATDDAPYLYIYQMTDAADSRVKISVQNAPCQEGEVKELNQSVFGIPYSKVVTSNVVNSFYRFIEPYNFKKDEIYSVKLRLENFSKSPNAAVGVAMFGLYTLTDSSDYTSKVDIIYAEPQATISEKEVEFTFKASGNANYIYFYLSSGTANATATLEMKRGGVIMEIAEIKENIGRLNIPVLDGKKYTGPRLDLSDYKFSKKKVATLSPSSTSYTNRQGNACFGNLFYQLYHGGFCDVYDIENDYANVGSFLLGSADASNHANEAVFIRGRHYNGNEIPLLLVTIGSSAEVMKASVENVVESSGTFTATQLQELTLDQSGFAAAGLVPYWGWPAWFAENDRLYVFGAKIRTTTQYADQYDENRYICTEFRMPDVSEGNVTLTADDVIAQHLYKFNVFVTQGGTIFNNKIIYTFGFGEQSAPDIIQVYDVNTDEILNRIDLSDISQEIESCSVHDGKLLVGFNSGDLLELKF